MDLQQAVTTELRAIRIGKGIEVESILRYLELSEQMFYRFERLAYKTKITRLKTLLDYYDVSLGEFFTKVESKITK